MQNHMVVHHSNGDSAYGTYGNDFQSFADAATYLSMNGGGTIYVFSDESLSLEPDHYPQPTRVNHETGLWLVDNDGNITRI